MDTNKETKVVKSTKKRKTAVKKADNSVDTLISQALTNSVPVETMERLLAMRTQLKEENARDAFNSDMAGFQGACPTIKKDKEVKDNRGNLLYAYAPIDSIVNQVKDLLAQYNFSYSIKTETLDGKVKATCIAKHILGHTEESTMEVPLGAKTGIMSQTQVVASALTFAKRYAFCNLFGIMTSDQDEENLLKDETVVKKDTTNYLNLLKSELYKRGAKDATSAVEKFNTITGSDIKAIPATNGNLAKELYEALMSSPAVQ